MSKPRASNEDQRRLIHLGSSVLALVYWLSGRETAIVIFAALTIGMLGIEAARMKTALGNRLYQRFLGAVTRPTEEHRFTGASYVFPGVLLAAILFSPTIAILSMLFMSVGDSAAGFIGQRYGRIPLGAKTLEGTLACFLACLILTLPADITHTVALAGATGATLAEFVPWSVLNDNLVIPVASGGVMTLLLAVGA